MISLLKRCAYRVAMPFAFLLVANAAPAQPAAAVNPAFDVGPSVEGISEYTLKANGLRVLLFPDASSPKITVNITYLVGSRHEGYGETGMAHLLEHMLFKSTPTVPDIVAHLTDLSHHWNASTSPDRTEYHEEVDTHSVPAAVELEFQRLLSASFTNNA